MPLVRVPSGTSPGKLKDIFRVTQDQVEAALKHITANYWEQKREREAEVNPE
ncbi:MAG: hypothetical protein P4L67_03655 [Candidatus Pacebacteria bacterium]|nr:hypothetical protein [Candidatus Paceibacterota bacterium]